MNAPAQISEKQRLDAIKADLEALGTDGWSRVEDGQGGFVEATAEFGERVVLLRFEGLATDVEKQFVADAPGHMRFLLGLVDRAIEKLKPPPPERDTSKDYAAEAAMKCGEPAFRLFLHERHGLERPLEADRATQRLRTLLGVTSRAELNSDAQAAERWRKLRDDFKAWRRAG